MSTTAALRPPAMRDESEYKRLIICCDGTWQASDKGVRTVPSNITRFARALKTSDLREDGQEIQQIAYYQAGVATGSYTSFESTYVGNLGIGLDANVISAYYFLSNNYEPGDEIMLYGFSRGAYTVRCVVSLVDRFGIIHKSHMDHFPEIFEAYQKRKSDADFDAYFRGMEYRFPTRRDVSIKVLGCWDTVGAMGLPEFWWVEKLGLNNAQKFRNVELSGIVENAFHALVLDEHRANFTPALWHLSKSPSTDRPKPNLLQCWFPGVHINSGGGSAKNLLTIMQAAEIAPGQRLATITRETDLEEIADITFGWMVDQSKPFLAFDHEYLHHVLQLHEHHLNLRCHPHPPAGYALGPIKDSYAGWLGALTGGSMARSPGQYDDRNKPVPNFISEDTNEYFHPCVRSRWFGLEDKWRPASLKDWKVTYVPEEKSETRSGWVWSKVLSDGKVLTIHERAVEAEAEGEGSMERKVMGENVYEALHGQHLL